MDICDELRSHWPSQDDPELDDEDRCCLLLGRRAADEIDRHKQDAERYRWLRSRPKEDCTAAWILAGDELDAAIDAMIAGDSGGCDV